MTKQELLIALNSRISLANLRGDWESVERYTAAWWDTREAETVSEVVPTIAALDAMVPLTERIIGEVL